MEHIVQQNELIPIIEHDGETAVNLRDLHDFLDVKRDFSNWAKQMFDYGFIEGEDYVEVLLAKNGEQVHGGHNRRDWAVTLDMAKEVSMIQRTEKGKQARQYFIEAEKKLHETLDELEVAERYVAELKRNRELEAQAQIDAPKAEAYDTFIGADGTYSVGNVAKMLGTSQNKLFTELRNHGVLIAKGAMRNTPYQQYMHHFAVKAYSYTRSDGNEGTSYTTRVQPSGVDFIRKKLKLEEVAA